jgi:hypothetical protein
VSTPHGHLPNVRNFSLKKARPYIPACESRHVNSACKEASPADDGIDEGETRFKPMVKEGSVHDSGYAAHRHGLREPRVMTVLGIHVGRATHQRSTLSSAGQGQVALSGVS